jgi:hypothetical protein
VIAQSLPMQAEITPVNMCICESVPTIDIHTYVLAIHGSAKASRLRCIGIT